MNAIRSRGSLLVIALLVGALAALAALARVDWADNTNTGRSTLPLGLREHEPLSERTRACGEDVLEDWFRDGRLDRRYEPGCYGAALRLLPEDGEPEVERRIRVEIRRAYVALTRTAPGASEQDPPEPDPSLPRQPRLIERLCGADAAAPPCGAGVQVGVDYDYVLYTHCGIEWAILNGRLWLAQPPLNDGFRSPPPGWGNPLAVGVMRMRAEDESEFRAGSLVARFVPAPPAYTREACD